MKKITFARACRCLQKSEKSVRKMMVEGCEFGQAIPGSGCRLVYFFHPAKFREYVGEKQFKKFFED